LVLPATQTHHFNTSNTQLTSMAWKFTAPLNHEIKTIVKPATVHLKHFNIRYIQYTNKRINLIIY
jgi:hypothetical protein